MGTAKEWLLVAITAVLWGGFSLLWESLRRSDKHVKPVVSLVDVLAYGSFGLLFGLGMTFGKRVFHWPLILPTIATAAVVLILGRFVRRRRRSSE